MKLTEAYCLFAAGLTFVTLTFGSEHNTTNRYRDNATDCPLSRQCRRCSCRVNGRFTSSYCPHPGEVLDSVLVIGGGRRGCPNSVAQLGDGFLRSFLTRSLELRGFSIGTLRNDTISGLMSVETLNLKSNNITDIEEGAFADLSNLRSLRLTSNRLQQLPLVALSKASHLTSLYVQHNKLTQLNITGDDSRIMLDSLETLDVSYNRITNISPQIIRRMPKLSNLQLHGTRIRCGCDLAWFREFRRCLCVFSHDRCYGDRTHNLVDYSIRYCPVMTAEKGLSCEVPRNCVILTTAPRTQQTPNSEPKKPMTGQWGPIISNPRDTTTMTPPTTHLVTSPTTDVLTSPKDSSKQHRECSGSSSQSELSLLCFILSNLVMVLKLSKVELS